MLGLAFGRLFSFCTVQSPAHYRAYRDARSRDRERGLSKLSGVDVHVYFAIRSAPFPTVAALRPSEGPQRSALVGGCWPMRRKVTGRTPSCYLAGRIPRPHRAHSRYLLHRAANSACCQTLTLSIAQGGQQRMLPALTLAQSGQQRVLPDIHPNRGRPTAHAALAQGGQQRVLPDTHPVDCTIALRFVDWANSQSL